MLPLRLSCVLLALMLTLSAQQDFRFVDFSDVSALQLNQDAAQIGNELVLAPSAISRRGTAFLATPVRVVDGFDTVFRFRIANRVAGGADGLAFVLHADPRGLNALGNHASAMGYGAFLSAPAGTAIANSLVVEMDTYLGNFNGTPDLSSNEISVHTGGAGDNSQDENFSIGRATPPVDMSDGSEHTVRVRYLPGVLQVWIDDLVNPLLTIPYDLLGGGTHVLPGTPVGGLPLLGGTDAYIGFAAGTGGAWQDHVLVSWEVAAPGRDACWFGSTPGAGGAPEDVLTIGGDAGGITRHVTVPALTSFPIEVATPSSSAGPALFVLFLHIGPPPPGGTFPLSFGEFCFQPLLNPLVAVLADGIGISAGVPWLPATPTPWSFPVSAPPGLTFTLQAALLDPTNGLSVSNALLLEAF